MNIGQKVRATKGIYEPPDECAPGGYLCRKGEELIVRAIVPASAYPIKVSHEHITDNSFGVTPEEIEEWPATT